MEEEIPRKICGLWNPIWVGSEKSRDRRFWWGWRTIGLIVYTGNELERQEFSWIYLENWWRNLLSYLQSYMYRVLKRRVLVLSQLLFQAQEPARLVDPSEDSISWVKEDILFGLQDYLIHKEEICIKSEFKLCRLYLGGRKQVHISEKL